MRRCHDDHWSTTSQRIYDDRVYHKGDESHDIMYCRNDMTSTHFLFCTVFWIVLPVLLPLRKDDFPRDFTSPTELPAWIPFRSISRVFSDFPSTLEPEWPEFPKRTVCYRRMLLSISSSVGIAWCPFSPVKLSRYTVYCMCGSRFFLLRRGSIGWSNMWSNDDVDDDVMMSMMMWWCDDVDVMFSPSRARWCRVSLLSDFRWYPTSCEQLSSTVCQSTDHRERFTSSGMSSSILSMLPMRFSNPSFSNCLEVSRACDMMGPMLMTCPRWKTHEWIDQLGGGFGFR